MLILGAMFNYYEHYHRDILISTQMFLEEFKMSLISNRYKSWEDAVEQKRDLNGFKLSFNPYSADYYLALLNHEYKGTNIKKVINQSISVITKILTKIKLDHEIRPLRLFWIKADYFLVAKIVTLVGSLVSVITIYFLSQVNFDRYVQPLLLE
jgi:hypothetical protein